MEIYRNLLKMIERREPAALVTVVETRGSAPAKAGFKMLVDSRGRKSGNVGGGLLEIEAVEQALEAMKENSCRLYQRELTAREAEESGMICGGEVTLFIEPYLSSDTLLIVGAGHIALHLATMAKIAGFSVTVLDDREEFCNRRLFPDADRLLIGDIGQQLDQIEIDPQTYIAIMTRGHRYDQLALEKTIHSPAFYLGMIGSAKKIETTFNNLRDMGIDPQQLQQVHAPIGIKIGAQTPAEIAVSVLAEIIAVKRRAFKSRLAENLSRGQNEFST